MTDPRMARMGEAPARPRSGKSGLADSALVDQLAQQVLHWRVGPDRYLTQNRSWLPRWKFDPLNRLDQAFRLLDAAAPSRYGISFSNGRFHVEVEVKGIIGRASDTSRTRAIVTALGRSLKLKGTEE
jgi:hypothetical protein